MNNQLLFHDSLIVDIVGFTLSIYAAYENLVNKRISLFGMDRLLYLVTLIFVKDAGKRIKRDGTILRKWGIYFLLMAGGAILDALLNM